MDTLRPQVYFRGSSGGHRFRPWRTHTRHINPSLEHWNTERNQPLLPRSHDYQRVMDSKLVVLIIVISCILLCLLACPILICSYRKRRHRKELVKQLDLEGAHKEYAFKFQDGKWVPRDESRRDSGTYTNLIISKLRTARSPTSPKEPPSSPLSFSDYIPDAPFSPLVRTIPMSPQLPPPCRRQPTPIGQSPTLPSLVARDLSSMGYKTWAFPTGNCASPTPSTPRLGAVEGSQLPHVVLYPAPPGKGFAKKTSGSSLRQEMTGSPASFTKRPANPVGLRTLTPSPTPGLSPIPEQATPRTPRTPQRPPRVQLTSPTQQPVGLGISVPSRSPSPQTPQSVKPASLYEYYTYLSRPLPPKPPSPTSHNYEPGRGRQTGVWENILIGVRDTPLTFDTPSFIVSSPQGSSFSIPK